MSARRLPEILAPARVSTAPHVARDGEGQQGEEQDEVPVRVAGAVSIGEHDRATERGDLDGDKETGGAFGQGNTSLLAGCALRYRLCRGGRLSPRAAGADRSCPGRSGRAGFRAPWQYHLGTATKCARWHPSSCPASAIWRAPTRRTSWATGSARSLWRYSSTTRPGARSRPPRCSSGMQFAARLPRSRCWSRGSSRPAPSGCCRSLYLAEAATFVALAVTADNFAALAGGRCSPRSTAHSRSARAPSRAPRRRRC